MADIRASSFTTILRKAVIVEEVGLTRDVGAAVEHRAVHAGRMRDLSAAHLAAVHEIRMAKP